MTNNNQMPPLERFTDDAKNLVRLMHEVAIEKGSNTVNTLHLFVSFLIDEENIAVAVLRDMKVNTIAMMDYIMEEVLSDEPRLDNNHLKQIYLDSDIIKVLLESEKVLKELGGEQIAPEHLFFSLVVNANKNLQKIFSEFNLKIEDILNKILEFSKKDWKNEKPKKNNSNNKRFLEKFAKNLNKLALENKLDPVIGREKEISRMIEILSRKKKNNPLLVGDAGVGKTAIVEAVVQQIVSKKAPLNLLDKEIYSLEMGSLIAGTKFRGEFEERLKKIINEVVKLNGKVILFIDEIHTIVGTGVSDGSLDASNILKPALARGELPLIGATTYEEYTKYIQKDNALSRRFQVVKVDEPSVEESYKILNGLKKDYEIFHGIKITDEAIKSAVELSKRYIPDKFLPDKAIDLIDEASSIAKISYNLKNDKLEDLEKIIVDKEIEKRILEVSDKDKNKGAIEKIDKELKKTNQKIKKIEKETNEIKETVAKINILKTAISELEGKINKLMQEKKFDELYELQHIQLQALEKNLKKEEEKFNKKFSKIEKIITKKEIQNVISKITSIPVEKLEKDEITKLTKLEKNLKKKIIGQDEVVAQVVKALQKSRLGLSDPNKPLASFLFVGQTGTGKTELARVLARDYFEDEKSLIKIDMSEMMESHSVAKLIGSPPGYVGYEKGGSLVEEVRKRPYSIILFDEIEKANIDVLNILLQILDEGKLTDSKGRVADFKNTLIILTSNLIWDDKPDAKVINLFDETTPEIKKDLIGELKNYLSPEFLNRLDGVFKFKKLNEKDILKIAKNELEKIAQRLKEKEIELFVNEKDLEKILFKKNNYNFDFGAREVKRILEKDILDNLLEKILKNFDKGEKKYKINLKDNFEINFLELKEEQKTLAKAK